MAEKKPNTVCASCGKPIHQRPARLKRFKRALCSRSCRVGMIGRKFGRLTVLAFVEMRKHRQSYWLCQCTCGNTTVIGISSAREGGTKSCGCARLQPDPAANKRQPEYAIWCAMKNRCYNSNVSHYSRYGGRGIKVCARWRHSFKSFLADMGPRPSAKHSIERRDNNGDYNPNNCSWELKQVQARNTSTNRLITFNNETRCLVEWSEYTGLKAPTIWRRLKAGWSIERALTSPLQIRFKTR